MADSYRTFVQIEVPPGNAADEVAALEFGHFTDGPRDGMARFEVSFRGRTCSSLDSDSIGAAQESRTAASTARWRSELWGAIWVRQAWHFSGPKPGALGNSGTREPA